MHEETLSHDVCELLDACIDSVEALDALVLLHGDPSRWWAVPELARVLGVDAAAAQRAVHGLHTRGLASQAAAGTLFRLAPLEPYAYAAFAELKVAYERERRAIVEHVSRRSVARLRVLAQGFTRGSTA